MYSEEHKTFLKKRKRKKFLIHTCQLLIILIFIIAWQLLADYNLINTFITSSPKDIINTIINLHNTNNLYNHIGITVYETFISFSLGILIGLVVATILWWNDVLHKVIEPYLTVLNSLPKVALRTSYYHLGRCRNSCNYRNGNSYIFNCNYIRKFKWFYEN